MGVTLSIRDVPADQVERLKARAKRNHRSLQGELRAIIEEATGRRRKSIDDVIAELRTRNFSSPDEATAWIREDRDR